MRILVPIILHFQYSSWFFRVFLGFSQFSLSFFKISFDPGFPYMMIPNSKSYAKKLE